MKFNVYMTTLSAFLMTPPRAIFNGAQALANVGGLRPQDSETREIKSLNGIWNFRKSPVDPEFGFKHEWYKDDLSKTGPVIPMPVPASYNDMTLDVELRDHVGLVWYDYTFYTPRSWTEQEKRVWLRFESVHYAAQVWINGKSAMYHEIGHLPFEQEITMFLNYSKPNRVTVACDNTLLKDTIPQGYVSEIQTEAGTKLKQYYTFDFFNYAGIDRDVWLYTTPTVFIEDISIFTDIDNSSGIIDYTVTYGGYSGGDEINCYVEVQDADGNTVAENTGLTNTITLSNANFWWPVYMSETPGYLYTLVVHLSTSTNNIVDVYRQKFGIRTVTWNAKNLMINGENVYFRGFGKHEDAPHRGKGFDSVYLVKDYNLINWIGGNAFRTSHYPYTEKVYDMADEQGIMIIDECPSVDTDYYSDSLLAKHMDSLTELVKRDKNHPSVIMWSLANEPRTQLSEADSYFKKVAKHVKSMDTRPVTIALSRSFSEDKVGQHLDIISFNRYNAWYSNPGRLDMITNKVIAEAKAWHAKYNKPVLMSEYGADAMTGLHLNPSFIWSEEYQANLMSRHFQAFDALRQLGFFVGEFVWNFADFKTDQSYTRVGGNMKGIFTRLREPKESAFLLRQRYHMLASEINNATLPEDLFLYTAPNVFRNKLIIDEL